MIGTPSRIGIGQLGARRHQFLRFAVIGQLAARDRADQHLKQAGIDDVLGVLKASDMAGRL
jgi:hypothetical protein